MENQQQFESCHRVLEEVMWGRVEGEEGVEEENSGGRKKGRKWKLFRRRKKNGKTLEVGDLYSCANPCAVRRNSLVDIIL